MRAILGVREGDLARFADLRCFAIEPAASEISQLSRLTLSYTQNGSTDDPFQSYHLYLLATEAPIVHLKPTGTGDELRIFMTAGSVSDYTGVAALLGSLPSTDWLLAD